VTSSKLWLYRSTVDMVGDANAGLLGPLIVTRADAALPNKQPKDVAQTFIAIFQVFLPCLQSLRAYLNSDISLPFHQNQKRTGICC
jgi:hypothetical protein